jgi:hypothetical protein
MMPLYTLHSKIRCDLFRYKNIQLVIPPHRINFIDPANKHKASNAPWAAVWFCYKFKLRKDINYPNIIKNESERL